MKNEFAIFSTELNSTTLVFFFWTDAVGAAFWTENKRGGYVAIPRAQLCDAHNLRDAS